MKNKIFGLSAFVIASLLVMAVLVNPLFIPAQAAPPAAPTPVADFLVQGVQARAFNFQPQTAIATDTNTSGVDVMSLGAVDIQYVIDHGTVNTTTLIVQYSNDDSNWVNGLTLVSASAADGTSITRVPVFGKWMRINQDVATVDTITITLTAVGR